jgi:hypothetical protein
MARNWHEIVLISRSRKNGSEILRGRTNRERSVRSHVVLFVIDE